MGKSMAFFDGYFLFAESLSPEQRLAFYDAVMRYAFKGEMPDEGSSAWGAFMLVKATLDKSLSMSELGRRGGAAKTARKADAVKANGALGGRPAGSMTAKPKRKTKAENLTETKAGNLSAEPNRNLSEEPNENLTNENENENENYTRSSERVKTRPRARIEPDFLRNAAAQLGIPREFADEFAEIMRTQDWAYINPTGRTVAVNLGNVKTVMGCFWKRERDRRAEAGGGCDPSAPMSDETRRILAKTRK